MKEICETEIAQVNGGNQLLLGVGIGLAVNYTYESIGGADGINRYFENSWASMKSSIDYNVRRLRRTFELNRP
tara:strand:+ start:1862 stop:2080 length:219 start_codon:yes stop_codon:yes gene_type:complete